MSRIRSNGPGPTDRPSAAWRDLLHAIGRADDPAVLAALLWRASRELIGASGFSFLAPMGPIVEDHHFHCRSDHFPDREIHRRACDTLHHVVAELGTVDRHLEHDPVFDAAERYRGVGLERTRIYNELWRPFKVERQLLGMLGDRREPLGVLCVTRSARERPFRERELHMVRRLHGATSAALRAIRASRGLRDADMAAALSSTVPLACALFDATGRLLWLSEECEVRLGLVTGRVGSAHIIGREPDLLRRMRSLAKPAACRPDAAGPVADVPEEKVRLAARRSETPSGPRVLVVLEDLAAEKPVRDAPARWVAALRPREAEVARFAAEGYSVANIAAHLGISPETVKVHLKRTYRALGVSNRAELACVVMARRE